MRLLTDPPRLDGGGQGAQVGLGGQRLEGVERSPPIGDEPLGSRADRADLLDVGALDRQGEVGQSLARRARPR